jgi:uncharacterized lipoprotein YmbA
MMGRIAASITACGFTVLSGGCASPPSHLYTLSRSEAAAVRPDEISSKLEVVVGPVSVPAIVDVPQIVVQKGPNQVKLDEFNRWASPLANNISHVVAANLTTMLGTSRVTYFPSADADYSVAIDVQTFESAPGDAATLTASWTVHGLKDDKTKTGRTAITEPSPEKGYEALAAAHSRALGRLSQDIADTIRVLDHPAP